MDYAYFKDPVAVAAGEEAAPTAIDEDETPNQGRMTHCIVM